MGSKLRSWFPLCLARQRRPVLALLPPACLLHDHALGTDLISQLGLIWVLVAACHCRLCRLLGLQRLHFLRLHALQSLSHIGADHRVRMEWKAIVDRCFSCFLHLMTHLKLGHNILVNKVCNVLAIHNLGHHILCKAHISSQQKQAAGSQMHKAQRHLRACIGRARVPCVLPSRRHLRQ